MMMGLVIEQMQQDIRADLISEPCPEWGTTVGWQVDPHRAVFSLPSPNGPALRAKQRARLMATGAWLEGSVTAAVKHTISGRLGSNRN